MWFPTSSLRVNQGSLKSYNRCSLCNHLLPVLLFCIKVVKDLAEIDKLRPSVADIQVLQTILPVQLNFIFQVPLEVFDYIDSGRNPQLYTKDCMEKAHSKNEEVKGKIDAYRMFKARLLVELTHVFPKEMAVYRATRGDERGAQ